MKHGNALAISQWNKGMPYFSKEHGNALFLNGTGISSDQSPQATLTTSSNHRLRACQARRNSVNTLHLLNVIATQQIEPLRENMYEHTDFRKQATSQGSCISCNIDYNIFLAKRCGLYNRTKIITLYNKTQFTTHVSPGILHLQLQAFQHSQMQHAAFLYHSQHHDVEQHPWHFLMSVNQEWTFYCCSALLVVYKSMITNRKNTFKTERLSQDAVKPKDFLRILKAVSRILKTMVYLDF